MVSVVWSGHKDPFPAEVGAKSSMEKALHSLPSKTNKTFFGYARTKGPNDHEITD